MPLPENTIKITGLSAGTVKGGSLLATSEPDSSTPPVYSSSKVSAADIADFVANDKNYAELTETTDKTLVGAINEIAQGGGGGGSSTLAGLTDVDLTTPTDGQALVYDADSAKWVNGAGGGGNADFVELTQAEYDALEQAGLLEEDMMYFITDGQSPVSTDIIDDTTTAADKVWSSQKTNSEISTVAATVPTIDDGTTSASKLWSSSKTNTAITTVASTVTEIVKATRQSLTQPTGTSYFTFSGIPAKTGYTRMVIGANPSEGGVSYLRFVEVSDDLRIYMNNASGASVTYDMTIAVAYIKD